ncbi:MAG: WYL domain-containing protein [Gammaproteobacteria bacterium]|nr:MAG: WYL domain-containing protein [Gammaproteobacteria bacterium]
MLTSTLPATLPITETLRLDRLERFRLLEIISLWEGRLTTATLRNAFGISRQQASKDINTYLKDIAADNLNYDKSLKCYVPTDDFKPVFTSGQASEYLTWLQTQQQCVALLGGQSTPSPQFTEIISLQSHAISPEILRPLIAAIRNQGTLQADYISLSSQRIKTRTLTPHTLVNNGIRWHVRAYCHDQEEFRDFVISRFQNTPQAHIALDTESSSRSSKDQDHQWQQQVTLQIIPNPKLSQIQQQIIAKDYGMHDHQLTLTTKAALVQYCLQHFRIDLNAHDTRTSNSSTSNTSTSNNSTQSALAQPIVLANATDIEPYLFTGAR